MQNPLSLSSELWAWLARLANAKRVKDCAVIDGNQPPTWVHQDGYTTWKNGRPKKYTRAVSTVTVGEQWLAEVFPVEYVAMRLSGNRHLAMDTAAITLGVGRWQNVQRQAEQFTKDAAVNAQRWALLSSRRENDRDFNPEEARLYA